MTGSSNKPKPEISKGMPFDCLEEKYAVDCGYETFDCEDVITSEKGKDKYETMV